MIELLSYLPIAGLPICNSRQQREVVSTRIADNAQVKADKGMKTIKMTNLTSTVHNTNNKR